MRARFEFDATHGLLLLRAEGQFTEESVRSNQASVRRYSTATGAQAAIFDLSGVTEFELSTNFIKSLAQEGPSMGASCPPHHRRPFCPWLRPLTYVSELRRSDPPPPASRADHG